MAKQLKIPVEILFDLYVNQKKSCSDIGKIYERDAQTIHNWLVKHSIPRRSYSESLKGREHTWGNKIGESLKGYKHSNESKNKISIKAIGRKSPLKGLRKATHPEKIKYGVPKEKHWNWKGGISSFNKSFRQTSEYKVWRDQVFKRDEYTCQFCDKKGGYLHAHHIIPLATLLKCDDDIKNDLILNIDNGWTTCIPCHKEIHSEKCNIS